MNCTRNSRCEKITKVADFLDFLGLLSYLLVTGCRRHDAGMSEDRFILVNVISEERKFCVLLKTATSILKRHLAWFNMLKTIT